MVGPAKMTTKDPDYSKKYYQKNKEARLEYQRKYCKENKEKIAEYRKTYRPNRKEYHKEYMKKNGDRVRKRANIMAKLKRSKLTAFLPKWRIEQIVELEMKK